MTAPDVPCLLKALGPQREAVNGGSGWWPEPGVWTAARDPVPCESGWHVCTPAQMVGWLPSTDRDLWLAEVNGAVVDDGDKLVAERARLVRRLDWCDRTARLFAADCAESVLDLFEVERPGDDRPRHAIETARRFATGDATPEELTAAKDAAAAATCRLAATDAPISAATCWAAWAAADAAAWADAADWAATTAATTAGYARAAAKDAQGRMLLARIDPQSTSTAAPACGGQEHHA